MSDALNRLINERENVRKNHVYYGFVAKPKKFFDNSLNYFNWDCIVPGRNNTPWDGGRFYFQLLFPPNYPDQPPMCVFNPPLFHPNISPQGILSLQILKKEGGWEPTTTIQNLLLSIQRIIHEPNMRATANIHAAELYRNDPGAYMLRAHEQSQKMLETSIS